MGEGPRYRMNLKRRREGRTDYRQRLRMLKSGKPRATVRMSNKHVRVQLIEYKPEGDHILAVASSLDLEEFGWNGYGRNIPSAYLVGYLAGKRALKQGIDEAVLDIGLNHPHPGGRYFSTLKGMVDAGVDIPHGSEIIPGEERIKGEHIGDEIAKNFQEVKTKLEDYQ
ncbi:MAG: 50S ribosomal protein L18 [Thermoplasmata archaeon]